MVDVQIKIQTLEDDKLAEKQHLLRVQDENRDLKLQLGEATENTGYLATAKKVLEVAYASMTQSTDAEKRTLTNKLLQLEKLHCAANRQNVISTEEIKQLKQDKDKLEKQLSELQIRLDGSQSALQRALGAQKVFV